MLLSEAGAVIRIVTEDLINPPSYGEEVKFVYFETDDIDLDATAYDYSDITLISGKYSKTFQSETGFTVRQLLKHILEIELGVRKENRDMTHVFLEGLHETEKRKFECWWGS